MMTPDDPGAVVISLRATQAVTGDQASLAH